MSDIKHCTRCRMEFKVADRYSIRNSLTRCGECYMEMTAPMKGPCRVPEDAVRLGLMDSPLATSIERRKALIPDGNWPE